MIVEDEPVSQEILKRYISDVPELELVSVCSNAIDAGREVREKAVDLIFLDITMPKLSGLDFYKSLQSPPDVIFTTAYPEYAVDGFEVNAIDYLVKPFSFERFMKAMNKLLDRYHMSTSASVDFVLLPADKKIHKVGTNEILFAEAMGDYVKVHLADKTLIVHNTLQRFQETLPPGRFMRIHKSFLIALDRIDYIEGNTVVIGKAQIPIGQTYRADFLSRLRA